jgi:aromatic ring-cleaving dioxygenase
MLMWSSILVLFFLSTAVQGHATFYPHRRQALKNVTTEPPSIISWHVHICYMLSKDSVHAAMELRNRTARHFASYLGPECTGRFDDGRLCMIRDHDFSTVLTVGPFPAGEWSIFVPRHYYGLIVPWLLQHRGNFSLLVHPNTGYEYGNYLFISLLLHICMEITISRLSHYHSNSLYCCLVMEITIQSTQQMYP